MLGKLDGSIGSVIRPAIVATLDLPTCIMRSSSGVRQVDHSPPTRRRARGIPERIAA